jgi:hypothetical protein
MLRATAKFVDLDGLRHTQANGSLLRLSGFSSLAGRDHGKNAWASYVSWTARQRRNRPFHDGIDVLARQQGETAVFILTAILQPRLAKQFLVLSP